MQRLLPIVLKAKPQGLSFEAANPRHAHERSVFKDTSIPDDKILIPGRLATTTNYIEHPQLVAEHVERFGPVEPYIAYLRLRSLVEGAQLASRRLWS
jgi:5-methyltetrahydropteroyltriglutamate--homocysteine methyltransferase